MMLRNFIVFTLLFTRAFVFAQDTTAILSHIDAARATLTNNPRLSAKKAILAFRLAKKIDNSRLEAYALNTMGSAYYFQNNLDSAEWYHNEAISIQNSNNDWIGLGRSYANLGNICMDRNQNDKAVKQFFLAEKKLLQANYTEGLAKLYNSMGSLFNKIQDYNNSISYYQKGINLAKELTDTSLNCALTINLANVYGSINQKTKALNLYLSTLNLVNSNDIYYVMICNNICESYIELNNFSRAKYYSSKALASIRNNQFDDYIKISTYGNHARILIKEGKNADAKILIDSALFFLKQIPDLTKEIDLKVQLSKALHNSSAYDAAFATLNEALILKDSLYRVNLEEKLSELNTVYEVEKKESQIASLNESRYKQKLINYLLTSVGIISVGLLLIMIRAFFRKKRDNQVIQFQKQLVEHKNKEITDSINYAKRIQEAILPSRADLASNLSNGFILYKPKDIVAGDFYWLEQVENSTYVAAADCTGHGVPGALVSVICSSALSKTLLEENKFETGLILDRTRELVIEKFSKSEENVQDGMDISLCRINGKELEWSGANNPLWVISDGELLEIKPNKQPIGKIDNPAAFTTHSLTLKANSMVYLFTDGYADQFGGEEGKKFKYKAFKELLIAISELTLNQQKEQLDAHFEAWKGAHEQVDDVCVIGIRC